MPQGFRLAARAGSPGDVEQDGGGRTRCIARWSVASTAPVGAASKRRQEIAAQRKSAQEEMPPQRSDQSL